MRKAILACLLALTIAAGILPMTSQSEEIHVHSFDDSYAIIWSGAEHNAYCECGEWQREGHIFDENGVCPCGTEQPVEHEHDWQMQFNLWFHWLECTICYQRQDTVNCDGCLDIPCSVCGNYPQGHPDANDDCYCDVCGWEFDHSPISNWYYDNETHWKQCFCGKTKEAVGEHDVQVGYCTICGAYVEPCKHKNTSWWCDSENPDYHLEVCNDCNIVITKEEHVMTDGACDLCGMSTGECKHRVTTWDFDQDGHCLRCRYCWQVIELWDEHTMIDNVCTTCGYNPCPNDEHTFGTDGFSQHVCQTCSYITNCGEDLDGDGCCDICGTELCTHANTEWQFEQVGHYLRCADCAIDLGPYEYHTSGECAICGYVPCRDNEHVYGTSNWYTRHTCQECGYRTDCVDKDNDGYCDRCNYRQCFHDNVEWIYDPEIAPNYHLAACADCKVGLYESWGEHTLVHGICSVCGYASDNFDMGDANHDGRINAKDSTLILQYSVGAINEGLAFCQECAEVSGDGRFNAKDATLILQFSTGMLDKFPADT